MEKLKAEKCSHSEENSDLLGQLLLKNLKHSLFDVHTN